MKAVPESLETWLKYFAQAVRDRDFDAGKKLFFAGSISFGTVCQRSENLDELITNQWQIVWPNTRDFDFEYDSARAIVTETTATVITGWQSTGFDREQIPQQRQGRATIVFQKYAGNWLAIHSHFSINPTFIHDPVIWHGTASRSDRQLL